MLLGFVGGLLCVAAAAAHRVSNTAFHQQEVESPRLSADYYGTTGIMELLGLGDVKLSNLTPKDINVLSSANPKGISDYFWGKKRPEEKKDEIEPAGEIAAAEMAEKIEPQPDMGRKTEPAPEIETPTESKVESEDVRTNSPPATSEAKPRVLNKILRPERESGDHEKEHEEKATGAGDNKDEPEGENPQIQSDKEPSSKSWIPFWGKNGEPKATKEEVKMGKSTVENEEKPSSTSWLQWGKSGDPKPTKEEVKMGKSTVENEEKSSSTSWLPWGKSGDPKPTKEEVKMGKSTVENEEKPSSTSWLPWGKSGDPKPTKEEVKMGKSTVENEEKPSSTSWLPWRKNGDPKPKKEDLASEMGKSTLETNKKPSSTSWLPFWGKSGNAQPKEDTPEKASETPKKEHEVPEKSGTSESLPPKPGFLTGWWGGSKLPEEPEGTKPTSIQEFEGVKEQTSENTSHVQKLETAEAVAGVETPQTITGESEMKLDTKEGDIQTLTSDSKLSPSDEKEFFTMEGKPKIPRLPLEVHQHASAEGIVKKMPSKSKSSSSHLNSEELFEIDLSPFKSKSSLSHLNSDELFEIDLLKPSLAATTTENHSFEMEYSNVKPNEIPPDTVEIPHHQIAASPDLDIIPDPDRIIAHGKKPSKDRLEMIPPPGPNDPPSVFEIGETSYPIEDSFVTMQNKLKPLRIGNQAAPAVIPNPLDILEPSNHIAPQNSRKKVAEISFQIPNQNVDDNVVIPPPGSDDPSSALKIGETSYPIENSFVTIQNQPKPLHIGNEAAPPVIPNPLDISEPSNHILPQKFINKPDKVSFQTPNQDVDDIVAQKYCDSVYAHAWFPAIRIRFLRGDKDAQYQSSCWKRLKWWMKSKICGTRYGKVTKSGVKMCKEHCHALPHNNGTLEPRCIPSQDTWVCKCDSTRNIGQYLFSDTLYLEVEGNVVPYPR